MALRNTLLRLAGYDPATLADHSRDDQQPLIHMGWAVAIGAIVASVNWAVGGYAFSGGSSVLAGGVAAVAGLIGFGVVVTVDRGILHAMDSHAGLRIALWPLVASRVALTCLVSTSTTEAVAPLLMKPELQLQSLKMREDSDRHRNNYLETRYNVPRLEASAASAETSLREARSALQLIPPDIQARLAAAHSCWREYATRRRRLRNKGLAEASARREIAAMASRCAQIEAAAHRLLQEYGDRARAAVAVAEDKYRDAIQAVKETTATVTAKEAEAATIELQAITPLNSIVLDNLISSDSAARLKFWSIFGLIMGLELLPLLSKLLLPQTVVGVRVATDRIISIGHHMSRRNASVEQDEIETAIRGSTASAMRDALDEPELRHFAAQLFAAKVKALLPMEVFKSLMHQIEVRDIDIQSFNRRHPSCAHILAQAWSETVDEVIQLLRRSPSHQSWTPTQHAA